jgi:hypothetical protein
MHQRAYDRPNIPQDMNKSGLREQNAQSEHGKRILRRSVDPSPLGILGISPQEEVRVRRRPASLRDFSASCLISRTLSDDHGVDGVANSSEKLVAADPHGRELGALAARRPLFVTALQRHRQPAEPPALLEGQDVWVLPETPGEDAGSGAGRADDEYWSVRASHICRRSIVEHDRQRDV